MKVQNFQSQKGREGPLYILAAGKDDLGFSEETVRSASHADFQFGPSSNLEEVSRDRRYPSPLGNYRSYHVRNDSAASYPS